MGNFDLARVGDKFTTPGGITLAHFGAGFRCLTVAATVVGTSAEDGATEEEESGCGPLCEEAAMWNAVGVAFMALCIVCGEGGLHWPNSPSTK